MTGATFSPDQGALLPELTPRLELVPLLARRPNLVASGTTGLGARAAMVPDRT